MSPQITSDNLPLSEVISALKSVPTVADLVENSVAANTRRAYQSDLRQFLSWGGVLPAPPELIAQYLADHCQTLSGATLARRVVAIGIAHRSAGFDSPIKSELVQRTLKGIRRTAAPQRASRPFRVDDLRCAVTSFGSTIKESRDAALLLLGFAAALRRCELCAVDCTDLRFVSEGLVVRVPRSKTDQEGKGREIAIARARGAICPVRAVEAWLDASAITHGPVFRPVLKGGKIGSARLSSEAVSRIVKNAAAAIGEDPAFYSGHSLRAGLATSAAAAGASTWKIRAQTGHRSEAMLARYVRDGDLFRDNVASLLF